MKSCGCEKCMKEKVAESGMKVDSGYTEKTYWHKELIKDSKDWFGQVKCKMFWWKFITENVMKVNKDPPAV